MKTDFMWKFEVSDSYNIDIILTFHDPVLLNYKCDCSVSVLKDVLPMSCTLNVTIKYCKKIDLNFHIKYILGVFAKL